MLVEACGSAAKYELLQLDKGNTEIPSQSVLRKIKSQEKIKHIQPVNIKEFNTDFLNNLITLANSYESTIDQGYIKKISVYPDFILHLCLFESLKCINLLPSHRRIMHLDATGSLVCIPKRNNRHQVNQYKRGYY